MFRYNTTFEGNGVNDIDARTVAFPGHCRVTEPAFDNTRPRYIVSRRFRDQEGSGYRRIRPSSVSRLSRRTFR